MKFVTDCRQKFINFFAFIHFVDEFPPLFQINQEELERLFEMAETQIKLILNAKHQQVNIFLTYYFHIPYYPTFQTHIENQGSSPSEAQVPQAANQMVRFFN